MEHKKDMECGYCKKNMMEEYTYCGYCGNKIVRKCKIVLIGDKNTGKSQYVNRLFTGNFTDDYIPTQGISTCVLERTHKEKNIYIDLCDTPANTDYGLNETYYWKSDGCIVFYTKYCDKKRTDTELQKFMDINPNATIVIVWNKVDIEGHQSFFDYSKRYENNKIIYFSMSCKGLHNINEPIESIMNNLF